MLPNALIIAPLIVAAVLVVSGFAKLRAPERARSAFAEMRVPDAFRRKSIVRLHPWAEIALAVVLLGAPGVLGFAAAVGSAGLMGIYLWLVIRAVRQPLDVDCACFGSLGDDRITWLTVWRNAWLVVLAGAAVILASEGPSVVTRLGNAGALETVVAGATTALTLWLVLARPRDVGLTEAESANSPLTHAAGAHPDDDYVRIRTPAVPVTLADGSVRTLRQLSGERAQLLLFVSEGCQSCIETIAAVPSWRTAMPQLDIRLALPTSPEVSGIASSVPPMTIHDTDYLTWESFGISGTPSALLLGADGLLAGGPVTGSEAVPAFVATVTAELGPSVAEA